MKRIAFVIAAAVMLSASTASAQFNISSAGFIADQTAAGNLFIGLETFEVNTAAPGAILGFGDPLAQGVANGPFPVGNLFPITIQSNTDPTGATPIPQGANGLVFVEQTAGFGNASDIVLSNTFVNGLDFIFSASDNITGVGFDVLNLLGGPTVSIQVFDTNNVLLAATVSPANAGGTNFLGYTAAPGTFIGRINIFDAAGAEGGDNILLFTVPEPGSMSLLLVCAVCLVGRRRRSRV